MAKIPPPRNPDPKKCRHTSKTYGNWYWSERLKAHWRSVTCANPKCNKRLPNETKK